MNHPRRNGFTIVELLVVIAIIAVLAGILFPIFAKAKENGLRASALQQSKQLGTAVLMYIEGVDGKLPMSTNYAQPESNPERLWTNVLLPLAKTESLFVAPGSEGKFAKSWADRGAATIGFNSSTAYDPSKGCEDDVADQQGCIGFKKVVSFDKQDDPTKSALLALTPGGEVANKYLGYEFSPYNGVVNFENPRLSPPLASDRDLVKEMGDTLPAEMLKPVYTRYMRSGSDDGFTPIIFADGHAKDYSAKQINDPASTIVWRLR
jgi:prepilin-type N-terminal cleavage/methylation domain-containing protein